MWIHWPFFPKTWTKGHWPLDDLWPHICWGHMCDSTQGSLCPSPMGIHQCMWIQWSILQITTYIHILHTYIHTTYYVQNEWSQSLTELSSGETKIGGHEWPPKLSEMKMKWGQNGILGGHFFTNWKSAIKLGVDRFRRIMILCKLYNPSPSGVTHTSKEIYLNKQNTSPPKLETREFSLCLSLSVSLSLFFSFITDKAQALGKSK